MKSLFGEAPGRIFAFGALLVALALALIVVRILAVPFVAALFVVYLFEPLVVMLQRRGLDRGTGFLLLLAATVIALCVSLVFMPAWLRLESLGATSQMFTEQFSIHMATLEKWLNTKLPIMRSFGIADQINTKAADMGHRFFDGLPGLITAFAVNLMLVPFIAFFMIRDGKRLKRASLAVVPNRYFEMCLLMFSRVDGQIGGYLRGRLIECILVGVAQALFMGVISLIAPQSYILLIAAVCGITNMIPYLGPIMGAAFGAVLYLGSGLPMSSLYGLAAAAIAAHLIDNIGIAPAVLSHNVDLHPLTVALLLVIGGELLGVLGLLIAIPVASTVKVIAQEVYANYQLQVRT